MFVDLPPSEQSSLEELVFLVKEDGMPESPAPRFPILVDSISVSSEDTKKPYDRSTDHKSAKRQLEQDAVVTCNMGNTRIIAQSI